MSFKGFSFTSLLTLVLGGMSLGCAQPIHTVVCLGDSITYGQTTDGAIGGYPSFLGKAHPELRVINLGQPAWTAEQIADLPILPCDAIILMAGTNSLVRTTPEEALRSVDRIMGNYSSIRIVLVAIPHVGSNAWKPVPDSVVNEYNARLRRLAALMGPRVVWVDPAWDKSDLSSDGVHPTNLAYKRLADTVWFALR